MLVLNRYLVAQDDSFQFHAAAKRAPATLLLPIYSTRRPAFTTPPSLRPAAPRAGLAPGAGRGLPRWRPRLLRARWGGSVASRARGPGVSAHQPQRRLR